MSSSKPSVKQPAAGPRGSGGTINLNIEMLLNVSLFWGLTRIVDKEMDFENFVR